MQDDVQNFLEAWEDLDPYGTSYIKVTQITTLLSRVRRVPGQTAAP